MALEHIKEYFKFPIRVYDPKSIKENESATERNPSLPLEEPAWVQGQARLPYEALAGCYFQDMFSLDREVKEVANEGFDCTMVVTTQFGEFVCTWKRAKFEEELDRYFEQMEEKARKTFKELTESTKDFNTGEE